jgi:U3 small nucleolar RNA-associated protein 15
MIITVIEELIDRNALKLALLNRSPEDLELLLQFILWKIRDPKAMNVLIYMLNLLIDFYMIMYGKNERISDLFNNILLSLKEEVEFEKSLIEVNSKIDSINTLILNIS